MKRRWLLAIGLTLVLAIVFLGGCTGSATTLGGILSTQQEGIWVSGRGEVSVVPDIVSLRLGIEAQEASVAEAQTKAAEAMNKVMAALTESGIDEKDIQTQYFSIQQVTKWNRETEEQIVIGYRVTNTVTAKIRDTDKAGSIIDAVAEAGGDLTRINGISFSVDDPSAYYEEARGKAMDEAEAKAKQLARLGGVTLGKPTYISESAQPITYPRAVYEEAAMLAPAETQISPGEMEISITVQVTYAILN